MKLNLAVIIFAMIACASEQSSNEKKAETRSQSLSGGTSSGGDQPFGFTLECEDEANSINITVTDSSTGTANINVSDNASGDSKTVRVSSHLFRYIAADVPTKEFFVRYKPISNLDVLVLLDFQLETSSSEGTKSYKATWYGTKDYPVSDQVSLTCREKE